MEEGRGTKEELGKNLKLRGSEGDERDGRQRSSKVLNLIFNEKSWRADKRTGGENN